MWASVVKWAAWLWPIVWRFVVPLLEGKLRKDLEFVLPIAERMVAAVEKAYSWKEKSGDEKAVAAKRLIRAELYAANPQRAETVPSRTVNLCVEMALERVLASTPANAPIPPSASGVERSGTVVTGGSK